MVSMCGEKTVPNFKDSLEGFGLVLEDGVIVKAEELISRRLQRLLRVSRVIL
jgi:hypothetical protein